MLKINEWTRVHDDKCNYNYDRNISERPLKYIMNDRITSHESYYNEPGIYIEGSHASIKDIQTSNELRSKATHLNDIRNLEERMYATTPYKGSGELIGKNELSDINSKLRGDSTRLTEDGKPLVEYHTPGFLPNDPQLGAMYPNDWVVGGRSSRNDMRNLYKKMCHD